jgi:hypothetical protein
MAIGAIATLFLIAGSSISQVQNPLILGRHWTGQAVDPVFEGYDTNPDGSFNMWFGYMNRNYEEEPDISVGPDNHFEPAPADRGQPTHFTVRRHKDVFAVVVPKDFGDQKLIWTVGVHGQVAKVTGTLDRVWMIDRKYTTRTANIQNPYSNLPPDVTLTPTAHAQTSVPLELALEAKDDGRPIRDGKPIGMTFAWAKYRGPGQVMFEPPKGKVVDGKATAKARFSEPGDYILQLVVDDGSGENAGNFGYHCCWTNRQVKVAVDRQ